MIRAERACALALLCALGWGAALAGSGQARTEVVSVIQTYSEEDLQFSRKNGYDLIQIQDERCVLQGEIGHPWLPQAEVHILLPPGSRILSTNARILEELELSQPYDIMPKQPDVPVSSPGPHPFVDKDPAVYGLTTALPSSVVEPANAIKTRGHIVAAVRVNPLAYVPATGRTTLRTRIRIDVEVAPGQDPDTVNYKKGSAKFKGMIRRDVANPEALSLYEESGETEKTPKVKGGKGKSLAETDIRTMTTTGTHDPAEYLLITANSLIDDFQPLLDWKKKKGVTYAAVSTESIQNDYTGVDLQEKIKYCILHYVENHGTVWVVLGGDDTVVPDRKCMIGWQYISWNNYIPKLSPTDLYYAGLDDMDWDDDNDGVWGEIASSGDSVDMGPDVFVGRLPVRTAAHAQAMVNKILAYEKNQPASGFSKKMLLTGNRVFSDGDAEEDSEAMYANYIQPYWSGTRYRFYDTATDFTGGASYDVSAANLQSQINAGYNYLHMATHGSPSVWAMEVLPQYSVTHALAQTNANKYVNISTIACSTNEFDSASVDPCLSEAFMRNANGGTVSYFGSSREGYGYSYYFDRLFYQFLFSGDSYGYPQQLGAAFAHMKEAHVSKCSYLGTWRWLQFSINLMGDPEMPLFATDPKTFNPWHESRAWLCQHTFRVQTRVPGARVCLSKGTEVYAFGEADSTGYFKATIQPLTTGNLAITITANDYDPYEATVPVTSPASGAICENACSAACGSYFDGGTQIPGTGEAYVPCLFSTGEPMAARWLNLAVPPQKAATVTLTEDDFMWHAGIAFYEDCASEPVDQTCSSNGVVSLTYENPSLSTRYVKVLTNVHWYANHPTIQVSCSTVYYGQTCKSGQPATCGNIYGGGYTTIPGRTTTSSVPCLSGYGQPLMSQWLTLTIPAEKAATVQVVDEDLSYLVGVAFYETCGGSLISQACATNGTTSLKYENPGSASVVLKALVSFHQYAADPRISVTCATVRYGQTCISAKPVECGGVYSVYNPIPGEGHDPLPCYQGNPTVRSQWLTYTVQPKWYLTVRVHDNDVHDYVGVGFYSACGTATPLNYSCNANGDVTASYLNSGTQPVTIKVLTNFSPETTLPETTISCSMVPGIDCRWGATAACGSFFSGWSNPVPGSGTDQVPCMAAYGEPVAGRWLDLTVPAKKAVTVSVTDGDFMYVVGIAFRFACGEAAFDMVCDDDGQVSLTYENPTSSAVALKVLVNCHYYAYHPDISVSCITVDYGQTCISPQPVGCGDVINAEQNPVPGYGSNMVPCMQGYGEPVAGRWLSLTVAPKTTALIRVEDIDIDYIVGAGVTTACGATLINQVCSASGDVTTWYTNSSTNPAEVKVLVNSHLYANHPQITVTCSTCDFATPATCGAILGGGGSSLPRGAYDVLPCFSGVAGSIATYWIDLTVPAYKTITVQAVDDDFMWYAGVGFYTACNQSAFSSNCRTDGSASLSYVNATPNVVYIKCLVNAHYAANTPSVYVTCN